jgi:hypothetical protein
MLVHVLLLAVMQSVTGRLSGCDFASSSCQDYQARQPGQYYCLAADQGGTPGLDRPCISQDTPATCIDMNTFSNGCGVQRPGVSCTDPAGLAAAVPAGQNVSNLFGFYYGPDALCMPWSAANITLRPGCFQSNCSTNDSILIAPFPSVSAQLQCAVNSSLLLSNVTGAPGLEVQCPTASLSACQALAPCPCVNGECLPNGVCACDMEWMGVNCTVHVSQVSGGGVLWQLWCLQQCCGPAAACLTCTFCMPCEQVVDFDSPDTASEPLVHMAHTVFSTAAYSYGTTEPAYNPEMSAEDSAQTDPQVASQAEPLNSLSVEASSTGSRFSNLGANLTNPNLTPLT